MRNWIDIIAEQAKTFSEDLSLDQVEDHKIVLGDKCNDEVDVLKTASNEKKKSILQKLERDLHEEVNFPSLGGGWAEVDAVAFRKANIALNITKLTEQVNAKYFILANANREPVMVMTIVGLGSMTVTATSLLKYNTTPDQGWTKNVQNLFTQLGSSATITYNGQPLI